MWMSAAPLHHSNYKFHSTADTCWHFCDLSLAQQSQMMNSLWKLQHVEVQHNRGPSHWGHSLFEVLDVILKLVEESLALIPDGAALDALLPCTHRHVP